MEPDPPEKTAADDQAPAAAPALAEPAPAEVPAPPPGVRAIFEHPWLVRFTHWLNAVSIFVLAASGLRIFTAFPSFGPKLPQKDFIDIPTALTLGGWLGGALRWHFTFMWIFGGAGVLYLIHEFASGRYRRAFFRWRDLPGVWPMVRHYFLFGPKPPEDENQMYNPLQKLAYTTILFCGGLALLTGMVLYKPAQFSPLARLLGGYHVTRIWHFVALCGFVGFVPGHVLMVILHGFDNFASMWTGWKRLR